MTFATPWLGVKRVAFVPLYRTQTLPDPPDQIPANWESLILDRVLYNPRREANGADRSLRAWLRAASSGLADIDPTVLKMQTIDKAGVDPDELEGTLGDSLRAQGMDAAVLVMLGGRGAATNSGFWSRVVMAESNGAWLMEIIHGLTGFKDLYHFGNDVDPRYRDIDSFDEMSADSQTHPTAFTKNELGWLDARAIPLHAGASASYELQHISLAQPPVAGRVAAVRIGDGFPYVMVEARNMTDQFEAGMPSLNDDQEKGIASEGVIAYRIQTRNPTVQVREGFKKPLYLMTLTALKPGESAALDNGVTLTVTGAIPGGFAVVVDDHGWHHTDVTADAAAPAATGGPSGYMFDAQGTQHVVYRGGDGHIHELWWDANGWHHTDVTADAAAPASAGDPSGYMFDAQGTQHVVYRGGDGHIHEMWWDANGWHHTDATADAAAPAAAGDPSGYMFDAQGTQHVVYRGGDGHIHELWWDANGWHHTDATADAAAPAATGGPSGYMFDAQGTQHVVYRGGDGHIHELWWDANGWHHTDATADAAAPAAAGDPSGYMFDAQGTQHVVYRGGDGHIHELWWDANGWHHTDTTADAAAPAAAGDPSGYMFDAQGTQHVVYRGGDGHIHELWWDANGWHHTDATADAAAPAAAGDPSGYMFDAQGTQHVVYRGGDSHIHELWWG